MSWWTTISGLTPIVAYDALRTSGAQLLDGVGSNHLSSTALIQPFHWQYKGVAGNSNPLLMTSGVALPAAAVVAAFVKYSHVYTLWSLGVGGNTTMFNYAADSMFYFSAGSSWASTGTAQTGLLLNQYVFLAIVNGADFHVLAESISRERSFGDASIKVTGRGQNAVLAAPYAPVMSFSNAEARTARHCSAK